MGDTEARLLAALDQTKSFEEAAVHLLRAALGVSEELFAKNNQAPQGRILRGTVQIRPDGALRRMAVLAAEAARSDRAPDVGALLKTGADTFAVSATAWRMVVEHGVPVSLDVNKGTMWLHGKAQEAPQVFPHAAFSYDSQRRLLGRQATHVVVFPLRPQGHDVEGMLSLEAECLQAVGRDLLGSKEIIEGVTPLTELATVYVTRLPVSSARGTPDVDEFLPVIGSTMGPLVQLLRVFSQQEETLLLTGPMGSGKTRLARWCHEQSRRRHRFFEALDLVGVPAEQQLAALFGCRQVALNGTVQESAGSVARAEGGTLFLDGVETLTPQAQTGLLHLLEHRTYRRLGEIDLRPADVRLIMATHIDLRDAVRSHGFREDLYYRINVLPARVPPLEERRDEIPRWAHDMLGRRHREAGNPGQVFLSPTAERRLASVSWPGNLRQLEVILRRAYALVLSERTLSGADLTVEEPHIARALGYEEAPAPRAIVDLLMQAAACFVREAQDRNPPLELDLADAYRGFVLGCAMQQFGRDEAFRMLGKETLVRNRNHHKALRREMEKVELLVRAFGYERSPFADLLGKEPEYKEPEEDGSDED